MGERDQKEGNTRQTTNVGTRDQGQSTKRSVCISSYLFVHRSAFRSAVSLVIPGNKERRRKLLQISEGLCVWRLPQ